jgi:outer membrane protein OmpA-like peptidoglycan-associated protein
MKILVIGFIAFLGWSALSTYVYVCMIHGLCGDPVNMQISKVDNIGNIANDTIHKSLVKEITVPQDLVIQFAFDKSDFNSNAFSNTYFEESTKYLNQNADSKISITGYTDAIGTRAYNQALGYRRAQVIKSYLEKQGVSPGKIIVSSKGENGSIGDNNTKAGRAKNRRTVVTIKK